MEIKTKFAIGDKVFVLKEGKAREIEIKSVIVTTDEKVYYSGDTASSFILQPVPEELCFATKEELIEYITSD